MSDVMQEPTAPSSAEWDQFRKLQSRAPSSSTSTSRKLTPYSNIQRPHSLLKPFDVQRPATAPLPQASPSSIYAGTGRWPPSSVFHSSPSNNATSAMMYTRLPSSQRSSLVPQLPISHDAHQALQSLFSNCDILNLSSTFRLTSDGHARRIALS